MNNNIVKTEKNYWHSADRRGGDRSGVTLIELLVVMGVLGFLAGMSMFALRGAQNDARAARTRETITKLNDIILQQWEEYRYRAVDLRLESATGPVRPIDQAHLRMLILRDTMRMEMPDRASDLLLAPSRYVTSTGVELRERAFAPKFGLLFSAMANAVNNSNLVVPAGQILPLPLTLPQDTPGYEDLARIPGDPRQFVGDEQIRLLDREVDSSELLYLIVANSSYGGIPALEYFRPSEIGDPDGDGLLEFIDAWGKPIQWIRWPAGYPSDLNRYSGSDAMDPLRTDWRFRSGNLPEQFQWPEPMKPQTIVPLIVSAGPDELYGVTFGFENDQGEVVPLNYARMQQPFGNNRFYIDPFFTWDYQRHRPNGPESVAPFPDNPLAYPLGYRANQLGSVPRILPDGSPNTQAADNITNHDIILGY